MSLEAEARRLHLDITVGKSLRRDKRGINGLHCAIDDELCRKETGRGCVHHPGPGEAQGREQPVGESVDNRVPVWGGWVEPRPTVPNLGVGADDAEGMLRGFKDRAHPVVMSVHVVAIGIYSAIFAEKASDLLLSVGGTSCLSSSRLNRSPGPPLADRCGRRCPRSERCRRQSAGQSRLLRGRRARLPMPIRHSHRR